MCSPIESYNNELKWTIDEYSSLDKEWRFSDEFDIQGVKWCFGVRKQEYIDICLKCLVAENNKGWICNYESRLTVFKQGEYNDHHTTSSCERICESSNMMISFCCFSNKYDYIRNNSMKILINLDFIFFNFGSKLENYTDVIIEINDTQLYFNKGELAINSTYFSNLFIENKNKEITVKLDDVDLKNFLILLTTIYPTTLVTSHFAMNNNICSNPDRRIASSIFTTTGVLELADRFKFRTFHLRIATGMMTVLECFYRISGVDTDYLIKCISFGDQYGYPMVVSLAILCLKTPKDIKKNLDIFSL